MLPLSRDNHPGFQALRVSSVSDSEGKNPDSTVAMFFRGFRALGRKHQALLDFRGRDRWLIDGNQSIDVTFFLPGLCFKEVP